MFLLRLFLKIMLITVVTSKRNRIRIQRNRENETRFEWPQNDNRFDSIVGISIDDINVATGVWGYKDIILTANNPFIDKKVKSIIVHTVAQNISDPRLLNVECKFRRYQGDSGGKMGFDKLHSPLHDFLTLYVPNERYLYNDTSEEESGVMKYYYNNSDTSYFSHPNNYNGPSPRRYPYIANFYRPDRGGYRLKGWTIAGFGFVNKLHVEENRELAIVNHPEEEVLIDCDEWIPRAWGHFICISNIKRFDCLASGSALFYNFELAGIGSFEITKGNESVLVFTSIIKYLGKTKYCYHVSQPWIKKSESYNRTIHTSTSTY